MHKLIFYSCGGKNVKFILPLALLATTLAVSPSYANEEKIAAGKEVAKKCAGCHGMNGKSLSQTQPHLAGQRPKYLVKQLKAFKSGERKDPTMKMMVKNLTETDMENVAAYFASLK